MSEDARKNIFREDNFVIHDGQIIMVNRKNVDFVQQRYKIEIEGIEINVNWLENFGFLYHKSSTDHSEFQLYDVKLVLEDNQATLFHAGRVISNIHYVHELQNVFHILKGTDLHLKEGLSA